MNSTKNLIARQLEALAPRSILAVGVAAAPLVEAYCSVTDGCELVSVNAADALARLVDAPAATRFDFGVVAGCLETLDRDAGDALVARLRDILVRRLCVVVQESDQAADYPWKDAELTSLGLTLLEKAETDSGTLRVYGYDISSYKKTPDWLNPRHWANPQLWNKHRW